MHFKSQFIDSIYHKTSLIVVFMLMICCSYSQENSISPIFGLAHSSSSFKNDVVALNQSLGTEVIIESFSTESLIGKNFTVSTKLSNNVDKLHILKNDQSIDVYDLPYFFDSNYSGQKKNIQLSKIIDDLDYHQTKNLIYAYSLDSNSLYGLGLEDGSIKETNKLAFHVEPEDFCLKVNESFVVLSGMASDSTNILVYDIQTKQKQVIVLDELFTSFHITSHVSQSLFYAIAQDVNKTNYLYTINPESLEVKLVSDLPSCLQCTTEDLIFYKNALALDWTNENILAVVNEERSGLNSYFLLTIDALSGKLLDRVALERKVDNLYYNKVASDLVFPGDANHDGQVNSRDLLPIGLRFSYQTIPRFMQSTQWVGQHSFNTGVLAQGADVKHADCNGDGIINQEDIEVIRLNYSSIHNSNKTIHSSAADCDYPLAFSFVGATHQNNQAQINIKLGEDFEPVMDVYGVSFTVRYDTSLVVANSMQTNGLDSWFGIDGNNSVHTSIDNYTNGTIDISLTGVDLLNRSGGGDIIQLAWTIEDDVIPIANPFITMDLNIENTFIINLNEDILESCSMDTVIKITRKEDFVNISSLEELNVEIFPNPAKDYIHISGSEVIQSIDLIGINGDFIQRLKLNHNNPIQVSKVSTGVYFLRLNTKEGVYFEKIIIR